MNQPHQTQVKELLDKVFTGKTIEAIASMIGISVEEYLTYLSSEPRPAIHPETMKKISHAARDVGYSLAVSEIMRADIADVEGSIEIQVICATPSIKEAVVGMIHQMLRMAGSDNTSIILRNTITNQDVDRLYTAGAPQRQFTEHLGPLYHTMIVADPGDRFDLAFRAPVHHLHINRNHHWTYVNRPEDDPRAARNEREPGEPTPDLADPPKYW